MQSKSGAPTPLTPWFLKYVPVAFSLILLSLITGFSQIKTEGLAWQEANYWPRLEAVAHGTALAPDQYRLLSNGLAYATERIVEAVGAPRPVGVSFVFIRLLQNLVLFSLAYAFYRRLGITPYSALLGLSALAWGMTQANYGADLGFDVWTDVLFYLAAAIVLLDGRSGWLIPISALAALNRETSLLIPFLGIAFAVRTVPRLGLVRSQAAPAFAALGIWYVVSAGLHWKFGMRPWPSHASEAAPGFAFLQYHAVRSESWGHVAGALGILPLLAVACWRGWHARLKPVFWSIVPLWLLAHLFGPSLDQTRALLLPQILVFIPGVLCGLDWCRQQQRDGVPGLLA